MNDVVQTSKELADKLGECLEAAKGFGNSTFAPVPVAIAQQLIELLAPDHETECVGCGGLGSDARPFQLACKVGHIGPFKDQHGYYEKRRLPSGPLQRAIDCKHENARIECTACGIDLTGRYSQREPR